MVTDLGSVGLARRPQSRVGRPAAVLDLTPSGPVVADEGTGGGAEGEVGGHPAGGHLEAALCSGPDDRADPVRARAHLPDDRHFLR